MCTCGRNGWVEVYGIILKWKQCMVFSVLLIIFISENFHWIGNFDVQKIDLKIDWSNEPKIVSAI